MPTLQIEQADLEELQEAGIEHLISLIIRGSGLDEKGKRLFAALRKMEATAAVATFDSRMPAPAPRSGVIPAVDPLKLPRPEAKP